MYSGDNVSAPETDTTSGPNVGGAAHESLSYTLNVIVPAGDTPESKPPSVAVSWNVSPSGIDS